MAEEDLEELEEGFDSVEEDLEAVEEFEEELADEIEPDFDDTIDDEVEEEEVEDEEEAEEADETDEALEDLEAEELELLDDELAESLLVDEAAELRAIRREELTMNMDAHMARADEFVCQSCFLVKRTAQLANKRKMYCRDCAS